MRKALLSLALILCCSVALAQSPAPASPAGAAPDLQTLHQAIFAPNADPQPKVALCSPPANDVCVNKDCECVRFQCSRCGAKSFTCDEATGVSSCVCNTC
jgi:hypothetical protein